MGSDKPPLVFQLPIFRLALAGRFAVGLFFLVTGFVNSLNPIKNFTNGNMDVALPSLARSTFTRSGRLVLPTNAAAFTAWLFCQLGAFDLARVADSPWIRAVSRQAGPTPWAALKGLFVNMTLFWKDGGHTYDPTHWTIVFFLRGSMRIYLALLATSFVKTKYRYAIMVFLHCFAWYTSDCKNLHLLAPTSTL